MVFKIKREIDHKGQKTKQNENSLSKVGHQDQLLSNAFSIYATIGLILLDAMSGCNFTTATSSLYCVQQIYNELNSTIVGNGNGNVSASLAAIPYYSGNTIVLYNLIAAINWGNPVFVIPSTVLYEIFGLEICFGVALATMGLLNFVLPKAMMLDTGITFVILFLLGAANGTLYASCAPLARKVSPKYYVAVVTSTLSGAFTIGTQMPIVYQGSYCSIKTWTSVFYMFGGLTLTLIAILWIIPTIAIKVKERQLQSNVSGIHEAQRTNGKIKILYNKTSHQNVLGQKTDIAVTIADKQIGRRRSSITVVKKSMTVLIKNKYLYLFCISSIVMHMNRTYFITFIPQYFVQRFNTTLDMNRWYSLAPTVAAIIGSIIGGVLVDFLQRKKNVNFSIKTCHTAGTIIPSIMLILLASLPPHKMLALVLQCISFFFVNFLNASIFRGATILFRLDDKVAVAFIVVIGQLGSIALPYIVGLIGNFAISFGILSVGLLFAWATFMPIKF